MARRHRVAKPLLLSAALAGGLWLLSVSAFTLSALHLDAVDARNAGCVAIFAGRHNRVLAAIDRFATIDGFGKAEVPHMLIAGTTEGTNRAERNEMVARAPRYFECCAEFETESRNTLQNARASAAWARRRGCTRVTIVTDDYHLARALSAMRAVSSGLAVKGHAIRHLRSGDLGLSERARIIVPEFHKYLATQLTARR